MAEVTAATVAMNATGAQAATRVTRAGMRASGRGEKLKGGPNPISIFDLIIQTDFKCQI
jgi:hypothetical protein